MTEHRYVGKRLPRFDGMQHALAKTRYVNDMKFLNLLHVKVWRSPVASAKILNIDVSQAEKVPGVEIVLTHRHVPKNSYAGDYPVLAGEEIRYLGQEVVAVVAVDEDSAHDAVELVKVDLEERTPVLDPFKAMEPRSEEHTSELQSQSNLVC